MQGRICMVTGATDGIGKATALGLARLGATVIVVGRNPDKAEAVVAEIQEATGNRDIQPAIADFASLDQVRALALRFQARFERLDVLINNAGVVTRERQVSHDGHELMLAVNHLAPFLLTNLLLPSLQAAAPSRIVNVASMGYKQGDIHFGDLQSEQTFSHRAAYYQTRLASVLFTLALARRIEGTGVTANVLHPGIVKTTLSHNYMGNPIFRFFEQIIAISPEQGAQTSLFVATAPELAGVNGSYFEKQQAKALNDKAIDHTLQERLWAASATLVGLEGSASMDTQPHILARQSAHPA